VPRSDLWNQHLVEQTATLLVETLRWLRDRDLLDAAVLRCLPLDRARFGENSMFSPLFETARNALASEALLPRVGGGYISAINARLAISLRTGFFQSSQAHRVARRPEGTAA
jgi:hypothetical protein